MFKIVDARLPRHSALVVPLVRASNAIMMFTKALSNDNCCVQKHRWLVSVVICYAVAPRQPGPRDKIHH